MLFCFWQFIENILDFKLFLVCGNDIIIFGDFFIINFIHMNKAIWIGIVVVIVLVGGYFLFRNSFNTPSTSPAATPSDSSPATSNPVPAATNPTPSVQPTNKTSTITISNFSFNPAQLTIKVGTTVTWTNDDQPPHQIKSDSFNSGILNTGDSFSYKFNQPGTYSYSCAIHPSMTGTIIVQ